jgi:uncharacterized damage-inducible protein DinB
MGDIVDTTWNQIIWQQFGAAIDMLENAIQACPEPLWNDRARRPEFWHVAYHALFFLDLYLSGSAVGFAPPAPFTLSELDPSGAMPERPYTKDAVQSYLQYARRKCQAVCETLTTEQARRHCVFDWLEMSFAELLLYNLRHVQHHAGQLHLLLRQTTNAAPRWVRTAGEKSRVRKAG